MSRLEDIADLYTTMYSLDEGMTPEQQRRAKQVTKSLLDNPITKSSGAGALSPEAAEQLGDKAKELRKKKLSNVSLPKINTEEFEDEEELDDEIINELHSLPKEREVPDRNLKGLVKKAVQRIDTDVDGDTDHNDKAKGELGEFIPGVGNKRLYSNTGMKTALNNSFSDWRGDMVEAHWDPVTKTITDKKRTGTDPQLQAMAAKAATGKKVRKSGRNKTEFVPSSRDEAKANKASWDAYWEGSGKDKEIDEAYPNIQGTLNPWEDSKTGKSKIKLVIDRKTKKKKEIKASDTEKEVTEDFILEREMTDSEKKRESRLKDKYDDSEMKQNMIKKYGKKKGTQIYFAFIRKKSMEEGKENPLQKRARKNKEAMETGFMNLSDEERKKESERLGRYGGPKFATDMDEAKLFPNAEDPWGSTDKIKHRIKHTIKNRSAGYKEGENLKHTVMKKEGRKGKVEEPKPNKPVRLKAPTPPSVERRKKERVIKTPEGNIITNMPKGVKTPEEVFSRLEQAAAKRQKLERQYTSKTPKSVQASSDAASSDSSMTKISREASNTSARARNTKPAKKIKLGDTTSGGPVKIIRQEEYQNLYNDIIEALLDAEYALTVESADVLLESMTEDALSVITEQYLEEKARGTRKKKTAHIYDMDETLYGHDHSKVRVHVNDASGKRVQSLSNQEFNTHKLPKGHKYDFSEFGSSKTFQQSAKPLKKMIKHLKRQKARGYDTHIVTARSDFDDKHHLAKQLKRHGVDITPNKQGTHTHLHRSGNEEGTDVGKKKQKVLSRLAQRHGYGKIHMYDDAEKVHQATHGKTPGVKVKGHMVKPNKSGEVYSRPYKPTKPKGGKNNNN